MQNIRAIGEGEEWGGIDGHITANNAGRVGENDVTSPRLGLIEASAPITKPMHFESDACARIRAEVSITSSDPGVPAVFVGGNLRNMILCRGDVGWVQVEGSILSEIAPDNATGWVAGVKALGEITAVTVQGAIGSSSDCRIRAYVQAPTIDTITASYLNGIINGSPDDPWLGPPTPLAPAAITKFIIRGLGDTGDFGFGHLYATPVRNLEIWGSHKAEIWLSELPYGHYLKVGGVFDRRSRCGDTEIPTPPATVWVQNFPLAGQVEINGKGADDESPFVGWPWGAGEVLVGQRGRTDPDCKGPASQRARCRPVLQATFS